MSEITEQNSRLSFQDSIAADNLVKKRSQILKACEDRDMDALASLAASQGGFLDDDTRRFVCKFKERGENTHS